MRGVRVRLLRGRMEPVGKAVRLSLINRRAAKPPLCASRSFAGGLSAAHCVAWRARNRGLAEPYRARLGPFVTVRGTARAPARLNKRRYFAQSLRRLQGGCGPGKIGAFCIIAWGKGGCAAFGGGPGPGEGPGCHRIVAIHIDCSRCYTLTSFYSPTRYTPFGVEQDGVRTFVLYFVIIEEIQSGKMVENQGFADLSA